MSWHLGGVLETGIDVLDINLSDTVIVTTETGVFVVTTTGPGGGLVTYEMGSNGQMQVADSQPFPGSQQSAVSAQIAIVEIGGETLVIFGGDSDEAFGYVLSNNGQFGAMRRVEWSAIEEGAAQGAPGALEALALYDGIANMLVGTQVSPGSLVSAQIVSGHAQDYALTLDSDSGHLSSHSMNANGSTSVVASIGAIDGLALGNPTAMQIAEFDSGSYVVVASGTGSSLTVIEVLPDGRLVPVQQVIDTASTRFANVQDIALVQDGEHVFVLTIGADHGVSMFRLLPDGHLVFVEAFSDDWSTLLNTPRTISATIIDETLHVFVGTQSTGQMVHSQSDQSGLGMVETSSVTGADQLTGGGLDDILLAGSDNDTLQGGSGNDILSSGVGRNTLTGGTGSDIFVIRAESSTVRVTDFRPGHDRLDLSDLPMLRNLDQLEIISTSTGAIIRFRNVEIIVTSHNGATLRRSDLFPDGIQGPDSMIIVVGELEPVPGPPDPSDGMELIGDSGHDSLFGDSGADTLIGNRGNDRLYGLYGNDLLDGGMGHDRLWGAEGDDTLIGGAGNDLLYGGAGNDHITGEDDNDTIYGELGNDQIFAGDGNDIAFGDAGNDTLEGNRGNDILDGGTGDDSLSGNDDNDSLSGAAGNDTLRGGYGNDRLYGGDGTDLLDGWSGNDVLYGNDGSDYLLGRSGNDYLSGGDGNDTLSGSTGNDTLAGGRDNDRLYGGDGADRLDGWTGNDVLYGNEGSDYLLGRSGNDFLSGGDENDRLDGGSGNDRLRGDGGADTLIGGDGFDRLAGGDGADVLLGGRHGDKLWGGGGNDRLYGNSGNDRLDGERGTDSVFGGSGADTFVFQDGDDRLIVRDFSFRENDTLELDDALWGGGKSAAAVLDEYATVRDGDIILDFGGGDVIVLEGITNLNRLEDHITIV